MNRSRPDASGSSHALFEYKNEPGLFVFPDKINVAAFSRETPAITSTRDALRKNREMPNRHLGR